jgi:hypothetical protein
VLPLVQYVPITGLVAMSQTSKTLKNALNDTEVLSILKEKYDKLNVTVVNELYTRSNKVKDLLNAIKNDDAELVLFFLSNRHLGRDITVISSYDTETESDATDSDTSYDNLAFSYLLCYQ